jgi:2-polyprenyl-6-methoxyphenol hydroxylase-like FAD-dependent oxidoreductase
MQKEEQSQVLVVGAGPVGMWTALLLAESGIRVTLIDEEARKAARSYACALHPRTLKLLDRFGLASELVQAGRRIETMAFYEGGERRAELKLSALSAEFPFLLVVPQSALEGALEQRLRQKTHVDVRWNHRLSSLREENGIVVATIDKLVETARGYSVPTWDWVVGKTLQTPVSFLIGADGHNSYVRRALGIEYEGVSAPEGFEVYEFETDADPPLEVAVVLDKASTNVMWPLSGNRCRWSFQLASLENTIFPSKERLNIVVVPVGAEGPQQRVQSLLRERAPWFKGGVREVGWSSRVEFEHRLAKQFGRGRCWLVGDSAHQTGPVGMQSVNLGLGEADQLVGAVKGILSGATSLDLLEAYNQSRREEWQRLLGVKGGLKAGPKASGWLRDRCARILSCLPASVEDIGILARQLGLDWQ